MTNITLTYFFSHILKDIFFLILSSLFLRFLLEIFGQKWIKTISHTSTLTILPIVTYVITSVISGNIALSLGMVGALSIVRFRNPVRSPLELTVYFASITMGIAASVRLRWLVVLVASVLIATLILLIVSLFSNRFLKKQYFVNSFSEGNSLSTLEIKSSDNISLLDESKHLKSKHSKNESKVYLLASHDFESLKEITYKLKNLENIQEYQLNE